MKLPEDIALYHEPSDGNVRAQIVVLSRKLYSAGMGPKWWNDSDLLDDAAAQSIDRDWDWFAKPNPNGTPLPCQRVAIVTGDGLVQGAMIVSTDPVPSNLDKSQRCLFVDQLCTAPRNRPSLRRDQRRLYKGIGPIFLKWAVRLSQELGYGGKLWLIASPDAEFVYEKFGFELLNLAPAFHDGIQYKPMELSMDAVKELLKR